MAAFPGGNDLNATSLSGGPGGDDPAHVRPPVPQIFWASDPVQPDETVLVEGQDLDSAIVEVMRLEDGSPKAAAGWKRVSVLQATDQSLKFVLPADRKMGIFAWRLVKDGDVPSTVQTLNAPDVWWMQGDLGSTATPDGWLRVQGKSLAFGEASTARLVQVGGESIELKGNVDSDGFSVRFRIPDAMKLGSYKVSFHNGYGGPAGWRPAGSITIAAPLAWPTDKFSVLDVYGKDAEAKSRESLGKFRPVPDRTEGIRAALDKARKNGGGIVYFPAGKYGIQGELAIPPRTVLKGEAMGMVVLWWGQGRFNIDGGDQKGLAKEPAPKTPANLITGREFAIEDMSIYVPLQHQTAISAGDRFRMRRVRVRVDHLWDIDGSKRPEGAIARLGDNFEVTDCDIHAKGVGLIPGRWGIIAGNRIQAGKTNCPLGNCREVIVENNRFVSTYPTAYQNIAGVGRNIYYGHNSHEAITTHQSDFSFTFDSGPVAYVGKTAVDGVKLTLAGDPTYPKWAQEKHGVWNQAIVCIQEGRGAGQWREVVAHAGRQWTVDRPFECSPDANSILTIVPMAGRVLVVGNRFEDANWVNAAYGTSIDVVYSGNHLYRCGQLLNYGLATPTEVQPCWYTQFLDNHLHEGYASIDTTGSIRPADAFGGPITRCVVHRRQVMESDNSGDIKIAGKTRDVVVEGCVLDNPQSAIYADGDAEGLVFRNNRFEGATRYRGNRIEKSVVVPAK